MNLFISHYFYVIPTIDTFNIRFGVVKSNCVQIDVVLTYMNKLISKSITISVRYVVTDF